MSIFSLREPRNSWEMCLWSCLWGVTFMTLIDVEDLCLLCMGPVSGLGNLDSPGRHRMLHGGMHSLLQNLHSVGDGTGYFKPLLPCCLCPIDLQFQAETNPLSLQLLLLNILPQHQEKKPRGKHLLQGMQAPAPGYASTRPRACKHPPQGMLFTTDSNSLLIINLFNTFSFLLVSSWQDLPFGGFGHCMYISSSLLCHCSQQYPFFSVEFVVISISSFIMLVSRISFQFIQLKPQQILKSDLFMLASAVPQNFIPALLVFIYLLIFHYLWASLFVCFETRSHILIQTHLKFTMWFRLSLNKQKSSCLSRQSARIIGGRTHTWL